MTPNDFKQKIARMAVQIKQAVDADLPKIIGNKATGMFKQNFQQEGFFGQKWKEVKRRQHPPKHSRYPADARRKILTGRTANLGRSIRYTTGRGVAVFIAMHHIVNTTTREHRACHNASSLATIRKSNKWQKPKSNAALVTF